MFSVGQNIAYGVHGVCKIVGIEERKVDAKMVEYFVLEPIHQPGSFFYIPTQNPNALAKLRELISLDQLRQSLSTGTYNWIESENLRKQSYRELLTNTACSQLILAIRVVKQQKAAIWDAGKKFHLCDENFLRDAERLVNEELSIVLQVAPDNVAQCIEEFIVEV